MSLDLRRVSVELVHRTMDIGEIESMLSRQHPLGCRKAQGKRLYYAVSYEGEWIGALLFDGVTAEQKPPQTADVARTESNPRPGTPRDGSS
jgi:hypothetical protein